MLASKGFFRKIKEIRGFTLLEIMIVISVLGIIMLIAFPNFRSLRIDQALYTEATKIKSDFRYLQQIAFDTQNTCQMIYGENNYTLKLTSSPDILKNENLENNVRFLNSGTITIGGDGLPKGTSFPLTLTLVKDNIKTEIKIHSGGKIEIL
ncbi:MAG TPA: prepilin-type N-terminal cleavage/methylation domain-containing protein [Peptococcaceae bacterium]|nr:prepilin-type N-terminal cleavage/methylation domain-containing protein [Peptococcaceae bacterium]